MIASIKINIVISNDLNVNWAFNKSIESNDMKTFKELLPKIEINYNHYTCFRACFKEDKHDMFSMILDQAEPNDIELPVVHKWAAEWGAIDCLKQFDKRGAFNNYTEQKWNELLKWASISKAVTKDVVQKTMKYIDELND